MLFFSCVCRLFIHRASHSNAGVLFKVGASFSRACRRRRWYRRSAVGNYSWQLQIFVACGYNCAVVVRKS